MMLVSDFHFDLPEELIAQHPPAQRGDSRMLVLERKQGTANSERSGNQDHDPVLAGWNLRDAHFRDLPGLLRAGDLLVLNDSRVIPARLFARRTPVAASTQSQPPTCAIEVLLTEQLEPDLWHALVKPGRKVRVGDSLEFYDRLEFYANARAAAPLLTAHVLAAGEFGERTLRFDPVADFFSILARIGHMPLPPYIRRSQKDSSDSAEDENEDKERYQTVYAQQPGSAAAPTAGLHFTPQILAALRSRGVEIAHLTLHVGLGTFQPVRVERVEDIRLHSERYTLPAPTAEALRRALHERRRIVAVGTTTTRTLEHIARQAGAGEAGAGENAGTPKPEEMWVSRIAPHSGSTSIFLAPGHRFRIVSGLVTNFHLPQSTLLMLVCALAADRIAQGESSQDSAGAGDPDSGRRAVLAAYSHAVRQRYRFYSYGDCMMLL
jgi:S-adenosylmethionine:tRNA ribosyltransferase-isomerase